MRVVLVSTIAAMPTMRYIVRVCTPFKIFETIVGFITIDMIYIFIAIWIRNKTVGVNNMYSFVYEFVFFSLTSNLNVSIATNIWCNFSTGALVINHKIIVDQKTIYILSFLATSRFLVMQTTQDYRFPPSLLAESFVVISYNY